MRQREERKQQISSLFRAREVLTGAVLVLGLLVTYKVWEAAQHSATQAMQTAFSFQARTSSERIEQRMSLYEQVLRATVGFFNAADTVTREEFHTFVESLSLSENFPGIQGIGFARLVPAGAKEAFVASVRSEGFPDFHIEPDGKRDLYTAIVFLEPFRGRNLRAFGYDMYSEPNRREAMQEARDTGRAAVTRKVTLVQEYGESVQAGFLMYLPLYRNNMPHETRGQRRANLTGWVYAPFRVDDFMNGISGELGSDLDIELYDDGKLAPADRMYDSDPSSDATAAGREFSSLQKIVVGNRVWTIAAAATPEFLARLRSDRAQLILQAGISISLLAALLTWVFLDDRARALQAADQALQLALYDALTGLPNRKLLEERLRQALANARRNQRQVALLFIDLDKFKPVNDHYGHAYGDLLLKEVAKRLQGCMRESDTASRLGGDEFVALLSDVDGEKAVQLVANKALERLNQPFEIAGHTFHISASIGAALHPEHGADAKSLLKSADLAMYEAKHAGRSTVRFAPGGKPASASVT